MAIDDGVDDACLVSLGKGVTWLATLPKKMLVHELVTKIDPKDERLDPKP
jgi:hypothetical protein